MTVPENPYASPHTDTAAEPVAPLASADLEALRRKYLSHEASVRSVGTLFFVSGLVLGLMAVGAVVNLYTFGPLTSFLLQLPVYIGLSVLCFALREGLHRLAGWTRIPVILYSVLGVIVGLYSYHMATLVNGYVLYVMLSPKTGMVFSPYYHEVMARTPHIKYRTSWVTWMSLLLLIAVIVGIIAAMLWLRMK